jgi:hypothetical protein
MFAKKLPFAARPRSVAAVRAAPETSFRVDFTENMQKRQLSS